MKKWKIATAATCVCLLITMAYAAAVGGAEDPLITLSYLNNVFRGQVEKMADTAVENHRTALEQALNNVINSGGAKNASFMEVTLRRSQTLTGRTGCEMLVRTGSATCGLSGGASLTDTTGGLVLDRGGPLANNHLYMVTAGTSTVTTSGDSVVLLVRGPYTIG